MISAATPPVATSFAGELIVYVVFPLIVLGFAGAVTSVVKLLRSVRGIQRDMVKIKDHVMPEDGPSLRELVRGQGIELVQLRDRMPANRRGAS